MQRFYEGFKIASKYVQHRPKMSDEVAKCIMSFHKSFQKDSAHSTPASLMVDVGCGTGQSTSVFHPHFKKIIGIDVSMEQLKQARKHNTHENIRYLEGSGETMPVGTTSVDLVSATLAAHWFDLPKFFQEVERVLKPTGCLAITGYYVPTLRYLPKKYDNVLTEVSTKLLENAFHEFARDVKELTLSLKQVRERYKDIFEAIPFPLKERNDSIHLRYETSINGLCGFISSFSSYQLLIEKEIKKLKKNNSAITKEMVLEIDPLTKFSNDLLQLWDLKKNVMDKQIIELDYKLFILLAKP